MVDINRVGVPVRNIHVLAFGIDYRCSDGIPQRSVRRSCNDPPRRDLSGVAGTPNAEVFIFGVLAVAAVVVDAGASAGTTALTTASAAFSAATTLSGRTRADGCEKQSLLRI